MKQSTRIWYLILYVFITLNPKTWKHGMGRDLVGTGPGAENHH